LEGSIDSVLLSLKENELRTFIALRTLAKPDGEVSASMEELTQVTGYSRTTLFRTLSGLTDNNLIKTVRTKRNLGKLSYNKYQIVLGFKSEILKPSPSFNPETWVSEPGFKSETSTADYIATKVTTTNIDINNIKITNIAKEATVVSKWKDDDDEIGGFGLLEGEVPSSQKAKPASKRDPKTRFQRPQEDWTAFDVAAEFSSRLYDEIRGIPGIIPTTQLGKILATFRQKYSFTSVVELEVLERFATDPNNAPLVRKDPGSAYKLYLHALMTQSGKVINELGMNDEFEQKPEKNIYASDGRRFDNSMPGRASLARYEEKLKKNDI